MTEATVDPVHTAEWWGVCGEGTGLRLPSPQKHFLNNKHGRRLGRRALAGGNRVGGTHSRPSASSISVIASSHAETPTARRTATATLANML